MEAAFCRANQTDSNDIISSPDGNVNKMRVRACPSLFSILTHPNMSGDFALVIKEFANGTDTIE
jgi:hypothetical protein